MIALRSRLIALQPKRIVLKTAPLQGPGEDTECWGINAASSILMGTPRRNRHATNNFPWRRASKQVFDKGSNISHHSAIFTWHVIHLNTRYTLRKVDGHQLLILAHAYKFLCWNLNTRLSTANLKVISPVILIWWYNGCKFLYVFCNW